MLEHFACLPEGIERYVVLREHSVCMFDCVISQKGFYVFLFFCCVKAVLSLHLHDFNVIVIRFTLFDLYEKSRDTVCKTFCKMGRW